MIDFRLPNITGATPKEQMAQMQNYMRYFVEQLQWALNNINYAQPTESNTPQPQETKSVTAAFPYDPVTSFAALKPLIIKSAEIVNAYYEKISNRLEGEFVAASDFGTFQEQTSQDILSTSKETLQAFTNIQEIKKGLNADIKTISDEVGRLDADIISYKDDIDNNLSDVQKGIDNIKISIAEVNATIKSGLLYYDENGLPVYGLELGQTNIVDGIETFNKFARFTADRLSFYDQNEKEVAYISDRKLYINHVEVTATFQMGGFVESVFVDSSIVKRWVGRGGER
jgi:archaellum component FlaC